MSRMPASSAAAIRAAGTVFVAPTSVTPAGSRPARSAAAATRSRQSPTAAAIRPLMSVAHDHDRLASGDAVTPVREMVGRGRGVDPETVSYTHLRAHET